MACDIIGGNLFNVKEMKDEIFNEEGDKDEINLCILCCSKVKTDNQKAVEENVQVNFLFKNLSVIFLLKKVLQVPDAILERNLRECGNPDSWIVLCDQCNDLSRKAKELHSQIIKIARKLRNTEQLILDKVKSSLAPIKKRGHNPSVYNNNPDEQPRIWKTTREFIKNYNYRNPGDFINPFIEGDRLAAKYVENQKNPSQLTLEIFEDEPCELDDDYDTIWEAAEEERDQTDEEEPDDQPEEKLDKDWKPDPPSTTIINKQSSRLSERKKTKKPSTAKTKVPTNTKPRLKRNQIAHVKIYGKYKCNFCEKLYSSGHACYTHEREKHADVTDQFACDLCPKTYNTKRLLLHHKRQTHKIKEDGTPVIWKPKKVYKRSPTICNICGKSVTHLEQHHRIVHEQRVDCFCHVCGKGFKTANNWRHHLLAVHKDDPVTLKMKADGVNLWRCKVIGCNANFMKTSSLESHVEKVHGNSEGDGGGEAAKRFVCEICGKGFWRKDKLRRHELIHDKKVK